MVDVDVCPELEPTLGSFVDRSLERRKLLALLEAGRKVMVVQGEVDIGKSWLLQWCTDAWRRRLTDVRYIEIGGCHNWLDVVRAIRDGNPSREGSIYYPLEPGATAYLNWRLNALARGNADPDTSSFSVTEKEAPEVSLLSDPSRAMADAHIKAMQALQAALRQAAGGKTLVIVLDNFSAGDQGLADGYFNLIRDHWIEPFIARGADDIRLVLGLDKGRSERYGLDPPPTWCAITPLPHFPITEFRELILELLPLRYAARLGKDREAALKWLAEDLRDYDPQSPLNGLELNKQCERLLEYTLSKKKKWGTSV
jgi:hypothetical protein